MKNLQGYITLKELPSAGYSVGKLLDESAPEEDDGSEATVVTHNDYMYAAIAPITKYKGTVSDTPESDTASDVRDAHEIMAGVKNPEFAEWLVGTAYGLDEHVTRLGIQYVSMAPANLGNDPFTSLTSWLPCFARDDAFVKWQKGDDIPGGFDIIHNYRDAGYRQTFAWGKYNVGGFTGVGGGGKTFNASGVHLDGTIITGNATLEAIFKVGLSGEYHLLDVIAPEVVGVRTLLDARGAAAAVVDAIAGDRADVGVYQDDAAQRVTGSVGSTEVLFSVFSGVLSSGDALTSQRGLNSTGSSRATNFDNADSTSPAASKTDSAETRMKNYSVGVPSVLVLNEA